MKTKISLIILMFYLTTNFLYSQNIKKLWSTNSLGTYVLIGAEQMDNDPANEIVFLKHDINDPNKTNSRFVIFDGVTGRAIQY